ncbi:hypothetical protein COO60DRAFT_1133014 [Scenedesmus sp. NREL 46B-D3]|nr:hypothetical protein COO60DRAFT_1133014 [Scenedesmus sp. NREL 46B-D3]
MSAAAAPPAAWPCHYSTVLRPPLLQMEALQQQWDNTSSAMEGMAAEDKRLKKHVTRLQNQTEELQRASQQVISSEVALQQLHNDMQQLSSAQQQLATRLEVRRRPRVSRGWCRARMRVQKEAAVGAAFVQCTHFLKSSPLTQPWRSTTALLCCALMAFMQTMPCVSTPCMYSPSPAALCMRTSCVAGDLRRQQQPAAQRRRHGAAAGNPQQHTGRAASRPCTLCRVCWRVPAAAREDAAASAAAAAPSSYLSTLLAPAGAAPAGSGSGSGLSSLQLPGAAAGIAAGLMTITAAPRRQTWAAWVRRLRCTTLYTRASCASCSLGMRDL